MLALENGVVRHGPLLRKGQAAQLGSLFEGFLELKGHVFGAKNTQKTH